MEPIRTIRDCDLNTEGLEACTKAIRLNSEGSVETRSALVQKRGIVRTLWKEQSDSEGEERYEWAVARIIKIKSL